MSEERIERKLAAILHADVVGYGRLMQKDERAALQSLTECRGIFAAKVAASAGRIVNAPGDSVLAEFASVVNAVHCALDIQGALASRNAGRPEAERMHYRIGVNLGDVMVEDGAIYGDGVNVAARLESLAEPGGICISRAVRDQVAGKLEVAFEDMGEQQLKNVARPLRVFRARAAAPDSTPAGKPHRQDRPPLSIVVLPFSNLSGDPEQEYLADGITDDLTTDLSRISGSFVIARNTAYTYKGKAVDMKRLGSELHVQYALEGSVRRAGDRVRVNAQLIETGSGAHVWADRFDRPLGDMLALQDDVTGSIARVLRYELIEAESRRSLKEHPNNPQAIDYVLRASAVILRTQLSSRENVLEAKRLYETALRLDPQLLGALTGLIGALGVELNSQWSADPEATRAEVATLLARAESIAPNDARVLQARGNALLSERMPERALPYFEQALARDPNSTNLLLNLGWCQIFVGEPEASIAAVERALKRDPRGYLRGNMHGVLGTANLYLDRAAQAIPLLRTCCAELPALAFPRFVLASACALAGRMDEARAALTEFHRMRPGVGIAKLREEALSRHPKYLALRERLYEGLRLAGMED